MRGKAQLDGRPLSGLNHQSYF